MRDNPSQKQLWPLYFPTWFLGSTILIPHLRGDLDNLIDDLYSSSNRWFPFGNPETVLIPFPTAPTAGESSRLRGLGVSAEGGGPCGEGCAAGAGGAHRPGPDPPGRLGLGKARGFFGSEGLVLRIPYVGHSLPVAPRSAFQNEDFWGRPPSNSHGTRRRNGPFKRKTW